MLRRTAPLLLALTLLPGCGGSDSEAAGAQSSASPTTSPALSKADYLAAAEQVCSDVTTQIQGLPRPTGADAAERGLRSILDLTLAATTELEELAAPQPDAAELERIFTDPLREGLETAQDYLPQLAALLEALARKPVDPAEIAQLEELPAEVKDLPGPDTAAMRAYGFDRCLEVGVSG